MPGGRLTNLGLVLVVAGALLMAGPAFGFSTLSADRGVSVGTAPTESALLAIQPTGETPDNQNDVDVLTIANNADERFDSLDAQAEIVQDPNGALAISDEFGSSLDAGATTGLELTCAGGGNGEATIDVTADATGPTLSIRGITYSHSFEYSCTGGGGGPPGFSSVSAGDVTGSTTQEFAFTLDGALKNGETVTIDVTSLQADYSDAVVDTFTIGGSPGKERALAFDPNDGAATITVTAQGNIKAGEEVRIVLDGVEPVWNIFGWATFSTASAQSSDTFSISSGGGWSTTASTAPDGTITRAELETVPIDELDQFGTYEEIETAIESETDVRVVDERGE